MVHNETDVCVRRLHNYPAEIGVVGAPAETLLRSEVFLKDVLLIFDVGRRITLDPYIRRTCIKRTRPEENIVSFIVPLQKISWFNNLRS